MSIGNLPMQNKYYHHVTLAYGNVTSLPDFLGKEVTFVVDRYYCNEDGEAVTGFFEEAKLNDYAQQHSQKLHCTISTTDGVSPVYSNELVEKYFGESLEDEYEYLDCKVGAFVKYTDDSVGWVFGNEEG